MTNSLMLHMFSTTRRASAQHAARGRRVEFPITFADRTEGESKLSGSIVSEALVLVAKLWISDFRGRHRRRAEGF